MARHRRNQIPGFLRHVMSRGNGRMAIFLDDCDRRQFLHILDETVDTYELECWDYCLMGNHYHASLRPTQANISEAMRYLNGEYGRWWNSRHKHVGHVFQGRFKDQIVQHSEYLLALTRYIARNPVRAGLVDHPGQWPWSSYGAHAGDRPLPAFLMSEPILAQFGPDPLSRRAGYSACVLAERSDEGLEERIRSKERVLGDKAFKKLVRTQSGLALQVEAGSEVIERTETPQSQVVLGT